MSSIMLVSNDKELAQTLRKSLAGTDARLSNICKAAGNAIETFQQQQPDMIVLETFLPESSGLDVLRKIKQIDENCVFLMLSRLRLRTTIERAFRLGAHDVLHFPLEVDLLRQTILHRLKSQISERADAERQKDLE